MKGNEADRRVTSCNHDKDHHVIHLAEPAVNFLTGIYRVIEGVALLNFVVETALQLAGIADYIKKNHCKNKNCQSSNV